MSMLSLAPATRMFGWLASTAIAGSFCLFCEKGDAGLPTVTFASVPPGAGAAEPTLVPSKHSPIATLPIGRTRCARSIHFPPTRLLWRPCFGPATTVARRVVALPALAPRRGRRGIHTATGALELLEHGQALLREDLTGLACGTPAGRAAQDQLGRAVARLLGDDQSRHGARTRH